MSEIAGKLATQAGAFMLEKPFGGRGILLGGVPGVAAATVMIIGGGVVGHERGLHRDRHGGRGVRLRQVDRPPARARHRARRARSTVYSSTLSIEEMLPRADLVIGAVLVHGARAPRVDQARAAQADEAAAPCWSTSRSTRAAASRPRARRRTATRPTRSTASLHYCVANMPGAVPITSTYALTNATLPYVLALAEHGVAGARRARPGPAPRRQRRRRARHASRRRREPRPAARSARRGARAPHCRDHLT